jgi:hypothetical protein
MPGRKALKTPQISLRGEQLWLCHIFHPRAICNIFSSVVRLRKAKSDWLLYRTFVPTHEYCHATDTF